MSKILDFPRFVRSAASLSRLHRTVVGDDTREENSKITRARLLRYHAPSAPSAGSKGGQVSRCFS